MKKYLLGIFAIVMALGLTAFSNRESTPVGKADTPLFWYFIDAGDKVGNPVIDDAVQRTKGEVFSTVNCDDEPGGDCARGYGTTQTFGEDAPDPLGEDDHIMDDDL
jgi:hypothetical protein